MEAAAGVAPIVHYREVAFMGIVSVVKNLGKLTRIGRQIQAAMRDFAPDVVIPVDYADFNFRFILPYAKKELRCPVIYYILPKLWAWRAGRIRQLRRYVDLGLSILPFETSYFSDRGLRTAYIGNPCVDAQLSYLEAHPEHVGREQMILLVPGSRRSELQHNLSEMLQATAPYASTGWQVVIAGAPGLTAEDYCPYLQEHPETVEREQMLLLVPGSRQSELRDNLPEMLAATAAYSQLGWRVVIAGAPGLTAADYAPHLGKYSDTPILFGDTYGLMRRAHAALVTSGTATLEAGLWGIPMVVCYRMGGRCIARLAFERLFRVPYFSLVNLILDRPAVPELLADRAHSVQILSILSHLIPEEDHRRTDQLQALAQLQELMGTEPSAPHAARAILSYLHEAR